MRVLLKRSALADSGEADRLMTDIKKQEEVTQRLYAELSGLERLYSSLNEKILELANRLKNGAFPTREGQRLHSDLARMRGSLVDYDKKVQGKRNEYDQAKKTLQQMIGNFDRDYLSINLPEAK